MPLFTKLQLGKLNHLREFHNLMGLFALGKVKGIHFVSIIIVVRSFFCENIVFMLVK